MTVRAVVENLDDVPEEWKPEYQERDGKFYLDLDDSIKVHTQVAPLARTLDNVKRERQEAKDALKLALEKAAPDGFDAAEYKRLKDDDKKRKEDPDYKPADEAALKRTRDDYEERLRQAARDKAEALREKDGVIDNERGANAKRTKKDDLRSALAAVGVASHFIDAAEAMLTPRVKCERNDEGEYVTHVDTDLGQVSVAQYVDQWSKSAQGKPFVPEPKGGGAQGGGLPASREPNPFSHEFWNATKQGEIIKAKGEAFAAQLAAKAGTTVGGPKPPPVRRG